MKQAAGGGGGGERGGRGRGVYVLCVIITQSLRKSICDPHQNANFY